MKEHDKICLIVGERNNDKIVIQIKKIKHNR